MTSHEFQGTLYRNEAEMLDAIAAEWLTAAGSNSPESIDKMVSKISPDDEAKDAIVAWGLDVDHDDLAQSMKDFLADRPDKNEGWARQEIQKAAARDKESALAFASEKFNVHEVDIDEDGGVWISGPCTGHWLSDDHLVELAKAMIAA